VRSMLSSLALVDSSPIRHLNRAHATRVIRHIEAATDREMSRVLFDLREASDSSLPGITLPGPTSHAPLVA
jgi:hypothetical protein